jgi:hypothetical protein
MDLSVRSAKPGEEVFMIDFALGLWIGVGLKASIAERAHLRLWRLRVSTPLRNRVPYVVAAAKP